MSDKSAAEELIREIIANSIWQAASVDEEPVTVLTSWSVRRVAANFDNKGDSVHFVGWAGYEGRVSSPLQDYEKGNMRATSRSGRIYELVGPPGYDGDAEWVWGLYIKRNGNPPWEDITNEHVRALPTVDK